MLYFIIMQKTLLRLGVLLVVLFVLVIVVASYSTQPQTAQDTVATQQHALTTQPNIIFILTDDLDLATMSQFPKLKSLMADQGMTFTNHFVSLSLCCPSRSTILCGQYAHNTGVLTNDASNVDGTSGGYTAFMEHGDDEKTLANWFKAAGYRTALFGKYLNGYGVSEESASEVPSGWSDWAVPINGKPYNEYNYTLNVNGVKEEHYLDGCTTNTTEGCRKSEEKSSQASKDAEYMTHVLQAKATEYITESSKSNTPFLLYLATYAPHGPATPSAKYEGLLTDKKWLADHPLPKTPAFNEADVSDKPTWLTNGELLREKDIESGTELYHKRLASMYSVEDMIENLITTLEKTGQLENTYIVFTSDNGFHIGEHRLSQGKLTEFDTDLRAPLIVRGPNITPHSIEEALTANVDFAPTLAELAHITPASTVDGRSFAPLLFGNTTTPRLALLLEHADPGNVGAGEDTVLEPRDGGAGGNGKVGGEKATAYVGLRTPRYTYIHYTSYEEQELYDNSVDPHQLNNIAKTASPELLATMKKWATELSSCTGETCRLLESEDRLK